MNKCIKIFPNVLKRFKKTVIAKIHKKITVSQYCKLLLFKHFDFLILGDNFSARDYYAQINFSHN